VLQAVFEAVSAQADNALAQKAIQEAFANLEPEVEALSPEERTALELSLPLEAGQFGHFLGKAMRYDLFYDPLQTLAQLRIPVLALQGNRDVQVAADNVGRIRTYLRHPRSQAELLEGKNHLFQTCQACTVEEYQELSQTMAEEVLQQISRWLATVR